MNLYKLKNGKLDNQTNKSYCVSAFINNTHNIISKNIKREVFLLINNI